MRLDERQKVATISCCISRTIVGKTCSLKHSPLRDLISVSFGEQITQGKPRELVLAAVRPRCSRIAVLEIRGA